MAKRWKFVLTAVAFLAGLALAAPAGAAQTSSPAAKPRPTSYILPGDDVFPEGIAFQQSTGYFFVSGHKTGGTVDTFVNGEICRP